MNCIFCHREDVSTKSNEQKRIHKTENKFACSRCTQVLIRSTPEQLTQAYDKAKELNRVDAMNFLESFLPITETGGDENGKEDTGNNMDGSRAGRQVRFTRFQDRKVHNSRQLVKRGTKGH